MIAPLATPSISTGMPLAEHAYGTAFNCRPPSIISDSGPPDQKNSETFILLSMPPAISQRARRRNSFSTVLTHLITGLPFGRFTMEAAYWKGNIRPSIGRNTERRVICRFCIMRRIIRRRPRRQPERIAGIGTQGSPGPQGDNLAGHRALMPFRPPSLIRYHQADTRKGFRLRALSAHAVTSTLQKSSKPPGLQPCFGNATDAFSDGRLSAPGRGRRKGRLHPRCPWAGTGAGRAGALVKPHRDRLAAHAADSLDLDPSSGAIFRDGIGHMAAMKRMQDARFSRFRAQAGPEQRQRPVRWHRPDPDRGRHGGQDQPPPPPFPHVPHRPAAPPGSRPRLARKGRRRASPQQIAPDAVEDRRALRDQRIGEVVIGVVQHRQRLA